MTKKELRIQYHAKRSSLSDKDINRLDDLLLIRFQQLPLGDIETVLSYRPLHGKVEVNTRLMVDYLAFRIPGLRVAYPVIDDTGFTFTPFLAAAHTLYRKNPFGIEEPVDGAQIDVQDIDAVFVPLLIFDEKGYRVGYGKGYYDRFLNNCRQDVLKIGFSYFDPVPVIDDIHEFDVPLNVCITPNKIYEF